MSSLKTLTVIIVAAVIFIIAQIWLAREYSIRSTKVIEQLSNIDKPEAEKARQEAVSLRIENERKSFFLLTLLANVSALVAVIAAGAGVWIAVNKHYSEKSESKYNQAASALNSLCAGLTSTSTQEQVRSITGIQHFLTNEDPSFHARAVTALATTARHEQPRVVERTLVPALELAFKHASPDVVRSVSWQGLSICGGSFDGVNLSGVDFRDSKLEDCSFRDAKLIGARFDASNLKGANFKGADLTCANLEYADLAGASLVKANLTRSKLKGARILDADFYHATLTGASELREQKWRLAKSWRTATFDEETSRYLLSKFGAKNEEDRVLMILWEYPNVVSGGGWTAAYHLISQLVAEGKSLVVLIPWRTTDVDFNVFGHDIDLICAGLPSENGGAYGTGAYSYGPPAHIVDLVEEFTDVARSLLPLLSKAKCKAIHAHDWLTFPCAENIAKELRIPWIAHYHSLESERQEMPQPGVEEIEYAAARSAAGAIAVGPATAQTLKENCGDDVRVRVIPNCFTLDTGRIKRLGRFDTKSVRFFGRMAWQKAPDRFVGLAAEIHKLNSAAKFSLHGTGPMKLEIASMIRKLFPEPTYIAEPWLSSTQYTSNFIDQLQPVSIENGNIVFDGDALHSRSQRQSLEAFCEHLGRYGFQLQSMDAYEPYTHLVTLKAPLQGCTSFLINTNRYLHVLTSPIRMHDMVPWHSRSGAYSDATVIVVPSRAEPFGMVVLEAFEHGVPVVFSRNAGVAEVVPSDLSQGEEHMEWSLLIAKLLEDEEFWRSRVRQQHSALRDVCAASTVAQWTELYRQAAAL